jgi:hypothetical protein
MQSSLHSKEITTAQVAAVSWGFFNDEEASAGPARPARRTLNACAHQPSSR